jgi:hypothetical protein
MEIPRHWRLKAQRYRLGGSVCVNCGQRVFPPRPVCPHCTQRTQIVGAAPPILLTSMELMDIESHIRYEITERTIK